MHSIILYGSRYGSTRRYAEALSVQTGISAFSHTNAPSAFADAQTIVYLGALYAGGVLGLAATFRGFTLRPGQRLILATVGLADPAEPENQENIRSSLQRQLSPELYRAAQIFHLRGGIDYRRLSLPHRTMMALLHRVVGRQPVEQQSAENRALLETYGKQVDFTDLEALRPIADLLEETAVL